jgi:hypothetical protein
MFSPISLIMDIGQAEQDRQTGQAKQDRQNRTGKTGQAKQDRQNRAGKTEQAKEDCHNQGRLKKTGRTQNRIGRT